MQVLVNMECGIAWMNLVVVGIKLSMQRLVLEYLLTEFNVVVGIDVIQYSVHVYN